MIDSYFGIMIVCLIALQWLIPGCVAPSVAVQVHPSISVPSSVSTNHLNLYQSHQELKSRDNDFVNETVVQTEFNLTTAADALINFKIGSILSTADYLHVGSSSQLANLTDDQRAATLAIYNASTLTKEATDLGITTEEFSNSTYYNFAAAMLDIFGQVHRNVFNSGSFVKFTNGSTHLSKREPSQKGGGGGKASGGGKSGSSGGKSGSSSGAGHTGIGGRPVVGNGGRPRPYGSGNIGGNSRGQSSIYFIPIFYGPGTVDNNKDGFQSSLQIFTDSPIPDADAYISNRTGVTDDEITQEIRTIVSNTTQKYGIIDPKIGNYTQMELIVDGEFLRRLPGQHNTGFKMANNPLQTKLGKIAVVLLFSTIGALVTM